MRQSSVCVALLASGLALLVGCGPEPSPTHPGASGEPWFDEAVLEPAFVHAHALFAGVALLDFDNDGWLDIFLTNGRNRPSSLYRNNGDGSFTDVAEQAGLVSYFEDALAVAGDLDNDGDTDLIVAAECTTGSYSADGTHLLDGNKQLYLNNGDGSFEETPFRVPEEHAELLQQCAMSMHLADIDNDGFLDLVLANGIDPDVPPPWLYYKQDKTAQSWVLYNDGAGSFEGISGDFGYEVSFSAVTMDLDGDARQELILGQAGVDVSAWALQGRDSPTRRSGLIESGRGVWMGLSPADFDGDGDMDLLGGNQGLSALIAGYDNLVDIELAEGEWLNPFVSMMRNEGGRLEVTDWPVEAEMTLAGDLFDGMHGRYDEWLEPQDLQRYGWTWGSVPLDVDADGWIDVATVQNNCAPPMGVIWNEDRGAGPGALLRNDGGEGFVDVTWQAGTELVDAAGRYEDGRGIATGDLNNDGYADLVLVSHMYNPTQSDPVATVPGRARVLLSRPRAGHWLKVELRGTLSNRDGRGATVRVGGAPGAAVHTVGAGGNTGSSNDEVLVLGLGDAESVDLEIRFPSGRELSLEDVAADQHIVVEEPR